MTLSGIADLAWKIAKWSAIFAFICMDWTHSFPEGSWAKTFDTVFNIAVAVFFVVSFIDAIRSTKVS